MGFVTCVMYCCTQVLTPVLVWTDEDKSNLSHARQRCPIIYSESPCLTKFTKVEDKVYQAICGRNNN